MAKHIVNPVVTINGTDVSDHVYSMTVEIEAPAVASTAFGSGWATNIAGIKTGSIRMDFHNDFDNSISTIINPLLGTYATVTAKPLPGSAGTANPIGTAVVFVQSVQPINGSVGDISTASLTFPTQGTVTGFGL